MAEFDLVFEGGGAKGAAFGGAMDAFAKAGHTARRIIGTSAGAITATLIGAGYTAQELLEACNEIDPATNAPVFTTFMDAPKPEDFSDAVRQDSQTMALLKQVNIPFVGARLDSEILNNLLRVELYREVFSFNECGGFYAGNAFMSWFRNKLKAKSLDPDINWSEFARQTKSDVSVVTSDIKGPVVTPPDVLPASDRSAPEMVVLNARTAPNCPVAVSVRMSMSIPFVWREMIWQAEWGTYRGGSKTGHTFVDGGVLSNFPLALVTVPGKETTAIMGDTNPDDAKTLGLLLDETLEVAGATVSDARRPRLRSADRVTKLVDAMTGTADADVMRLFEKSICRLPVKGYGTTEFRMSQARMNLLIEAGRQAMIAYQNRLNATAANQA